MKSIINSLKDIHDLDLAKAFFADQVKPSTLVKKALVFAEEAHLGQTRKSGEPYIVHPILVASIVSSISEDEAMVIAALLHDVVEDTDHNIEIISKEFGEDVAHLVQGLTKIDKMRDMELIPSDSDEKLIVSALSFRKMLLASIQDIRVLVVKLCDRLHNMLTLDALSLAKQERIAEETMVVYAPIAHRLGISAIKNSLEDLSFKYIFPDDYNRINIYLEENFHQIQVSINDFIEKIQKTMIKNGFCEDDFEIKSRIKHSYSIYLKMQRKGISIDEVLDLLAVRILVKEPLSCYKVLGLMHLNFKPLSSRFKDYLAIAKDNGYQTLHTTVFDNTSIFEVQVRTFEMHNTAELGVAAHWKYKGGESNVNSVNLDWMQNLQLQGDNIEEFYELVKNDLYSEDILIFSPDGDPFTLPRGAVVLDFAFAVHSQVGNSAIGCMINKSKATLLTELKNGDLVSIDTGSEEITRCSWIDTVKTSKAKSNMRLICKQRLSQINTLSGINILATVLQLNQPRIIEWLDNNDLMDSICKVAIDSTYLKTIVRQYLEEIQKNSRFAGFLKRNKFKLKDYSFGSLEISSNTSISDMAFDYCCHPKAGDEIIAFKIDNKAHLHHKLCQHAYTLIEEETPMLSVHWSTQKVFHYHLIVSLQNAKGALANFLQYLAKMDIDLMSIELGKEKKSHVHFCEIEMQSLEGDLAKIRKKIDNKHKIIQLIRTDDAYR
ncbi:bifunctional (p)ppGpp synthetase/guanosine-3',5'-bis(diphosphate) 3'-pyrophosphohydrolase [Sulfurimonas sp. MAG313]|nr:RelA/SpoT family protein [Sulfurimonas sp. MAG313]MDF1880933.1 bifunctional (p)ppGpp synthetase/guanosine-3',5'-bis(diphosphate) 3'-pyrophosphohydrolase [Sulfurimonas sp. MAG313]